VTPDAATPPAPLPAGREGLRSAASRIVEAGRGAPAKSAGADRVVDRPRDHDTMAIVRTPARPSGRRAGDETGREGSREGARDLTPRPTGRDTSRGGSDRASGGSAADTRRMPTPGADAADYPVVDPVKPGGQAMPPVGKPPLTKQSPSVPAERVPAAAPGAPPERRTGTGDHERAMGSGRPAPTERLEPIRPADDPRDGASTGPNRTGGVAGRRARLRLARINPLTVTRLAFAFSLCIFLVIMVAVAVLWFVLNSIGVFDSVVNAAGTLTNGKNSNISGWLSFGRAMQVSLLIGAINVILMTVLATLGSLLYNLCADMVGGIEVTLSDQ
jgi:hypothetical protein